MQAADYDRFAVVIYGTPMVREAVEAIRREAPPCGRPMMAAHVTVKGSFVEPADLDHIADWVRHCCAAAASFSIVARQRRVWDDERSGMATIVLSVELSAALIRLHWHLVEHLRGLATTDYYGEDTGDFHPHLTLVQEIPLSELDAALTVIDRHQPDYVFEAAEAALCGRRAGQTWEPLATFPIGRA